MTGNRTFLEVASMVVTRFIVASFAQWRCMCNASIPSWTLSHQMNTCSHMISRCSFLVLFPQYYMNSCSIFPCNLPSYPSNTAISVKLVWCSQRIAAKAINLYYLILFRRSKDENACSVWLHTRQIYTHSSLHLSGLQVLVSYILLIEP